MTYQYSHPEYFIDWEKPDFKHYDGNIVLWGAGRIGGIAAHCLKKQNIKFAAFCDIASDKWGTEYCGHKVISPEELKHNYSHAAVLISNVFYSNVFQQLLSEGFADIWDCTSLFMEIDFDNYDFWMDPVYAIRNVEQYLSAILGQKTDRNIVDQIFLNITTKCTLRCKNCSVFIPYLPEQCNYNSLEIMEDFYKVLNSLKHIRVVNFYGGEPLLHPELPAMIRNLFCEKRIDRISAITNGTIVPNRDLIDAMKNEKRFLLRISDYGLLSSKLNEIRNILEKNNIKYEITNYAYWDETSKIEFMNSSEDELISRFRNCTACNLICILNRKLYLCSTGSAVCNIGGFPPSGDNYVDLSEDSANSQTTKYKILDYIARPKTGRYLDACRYCSGNHCVQFEHKVPVAEQTTELLTLNKLY